jgi:hypothetical protein
LWTIILDLILRHFKAIEGHYYKLKADHIRVYP